MGKDVRFSLPVSVEFWRGLAPLLQIKARLVHVPYVKGWHDGVAGCKQDRLRAERKAELWGMVHNLLEHDAQRCGLVSSPSRPSDDGSTPGSLMQAPEDGISVGSNCGYEMAHRPASVQVPRAEISEIYDHVMSWVGGDDMPPTCEPIGGRG